MRLSRCHVVGFRHGPWQFDGADSDEIRKELREEVQAKAKLERSGTRTWGRATEPIDEPFTPGALAERP